MPMLPPIAYEDSVEIIPSDEAADVRAAIVALQKILEHNHAQSGQFQGDVHVKSHGIAQGEFRVLPNLPSELAQGLFAHERTFPASVRFSNSASQLQSDAVPDGRGLAIKLRDVAGERLDLEPDGAPTQDFVMVNHPVFFAANVKEFLRFEKVLAADKSDKLAAAQEALTGGQWNPLQWHWRETLTAVQTATHWPAHLASITYYSMAPIRFGNYVAKYRVRPAGELPVSLVDLASTLGTQRDALRLMLAESLRSQQLLFEFQVQLRNSAETMPVEDASVAWPESESPYRTAALVLLPRQDINQESPAADSQLSFNVWHALAEHRPLGGINRLRRAVYPISAAWRRGCLA